MPTPHIESDKKLISPLIIMPGDPKRCEYIAKKYLEDYELVNEVRGEFAFTGYYKGVKVTVFSSGMGIPSMGIYSHELFSEYDAKAIIRIGSAGSYVKELNLKDLFLVESAYTESNYAKSYSNSSEKTVYSDAKLNDLIKETAKELKIDIKTGKCYSTESFYTESFDYNKLVSEQSCQCVEMESFSLFLNANILNKKAACLLTISDSFVTKELMTSTERENTFDNMIVLALESIIKLK